MAQIDLFNWNPRTAVLPGRLGQRFRFGPRVNNFGDLLGPLIVEGLRRHLGLADATPTRSTTLLTVGSVAHFATPGDVVWGSGVNGHWLTAEYSTSVDIRALRGPLSRRFLLERSLTEVPETYGDPALLLALIRPDLLAVERRLPVTLVTNLNESQTSHSNEHDSREIVVLDPKADLEHCLTTIAASELVVGTSLHGLVVAEALGIPARAIRPRREGSFKYLDYFNGTGRDFSPAESLTDALAKGGDVPPRWDPDRLVDAFPRDLWKQHAGNQDTAARA
jgi:pyruvyltransferase